MTPWHGWRNFHFVTWLLRVWQGPDFVRCRTEPGYFSIVWLSLRCNIQRRHAAEAKFTRLQTQYPNLGQNCHNEGCHIFWPLTLCDTVTVPIFRHVRYPLWCVTDESIETVQYCSRPLKSSVNSLHESKSLYFGANRPNFHGLYKHKKCNVLSNFWVGLPWACPVQAYVFWRERREK